MALLLWAASGIHTMRLFVTQRPLALAAAASFRAPSLLRSGFGYLSEKDCYVCASGATRSRTTAVHFSIHASLRARLLSVGLRPERRHW